MICFKQETFQTVLFYRMINAAQCCEFVYTG